MKNKSKLSYKCLYRATTLNFLSSLITVPAGFFMAGFTSKIVEKAIKGKTSDVIKISLHFASFILVYQILVCILNIIKERHTSRSNQKFKVQIYDGFLEQELPVIKALGVGGVIENLTNDISKVVQLFTVDLAKLINGIIMAMSYLGFIAFKDLLLSIVLLLIGFIQLIAPVIVQKFMIQNYNNNRDIEGKLTEYIIDGYKGMSTIKLFNLSKHYIEGLAKIHNDCFRIGIKSEITAQSNNAMDNAIDSILKFGTYAIVGWMILKNKTTVEVGVGTIVLSSGLFSSMKNIFASFPEIVVGKEAIRRLENLSVKQEQKYENDYKKNNNVEALVKVQNLSFSYEDEVVLKNVSFEIEKGDVVAIEGVNGSGKSTLLNILLGLYDNYEGELYIKGNSLKEVSKERYYDDICFLAQDEEGFSKSPLEVFSMLEASGQIDYKEALKLAQALNLNNEVLKNNIIKNLSGGEKKKIYLISCLLKNGDIVFLDEPGNALDVKAKDVLKDIILSCGKTVVMITHDEFFREIGTCNIRIENGHASIKRRVSAYEKKGFKRYAKDNVSFCDYGNI